MLGITDIRNNSKVEIDGEPFVVTYFQHVNPGKGGAFTRTKLKSLITGNVLERTFKAGDKIDEAHIEVFKMQYLYNDGDNYYFMNNHNYEQLHVAAAIIKEKRLWLKENMEVDMMFHNENPIDIELPFHEIYQIVHTEPGVRGDTATNVTKPAKLESGAEILVPLFVDIGEYVKVDTRTCEYLERAKK